MLPNKSGMSRLLLIAVRGQTINVRGGAGRICAGVVKGILPYRGAYTDLMFNRDLKPGPSGDESSTCKAATLLQ